MKLPVDAKTFCPASAETLADAELALGFVLPNELKRALSMSNGIRMPSGVVVYSATDITERNSKFQVPDYAPGYVAVGDDSGGQLLLLKLAGEKLLWVDGGVVSPEEGRDVKGGFRDWLAGCAPPDEPSFPPSRVDVLLAVLPPGGLKPLLTVKAQLGLEMSIQALRAATANLPALLLSDVPYGKYLVRARKLNASFPCVVLSHVGQPLIRVPVS